MKPLLHEKRWAGHPESGTMLATVRHIAKSLPKAVVVENVVGFRVPAWGEERSALEFFMAELSQLGYAGEVLLESDLQDIHDCVRARLA